MRIRCSVLSDSSHLPTYDSAIEIVILYDGIEDAKIATIPGLRKLEGPGKWGYLCIGGEIPLTLVRKGQGFLPEAFESEVLNRSSLRDNIIPIPETRHRSIIALYFALKDKRFSDLFTGTRLHDITEFVHSYTGRTADTSGIKFSVVIPAGASKPGGR
jgi:hypothetical protein